MSSLNVNQQRCAGVYPDNTISYTNACVSGFFAFLTIPGNLLVFVVVLKNPNNKMRSPFNWFILNLAIADLLVGMLVEPFSVVVHLREALRFPLKYHVFLQPIYFTACTASVFSLGMLTIDRHIAITSPLHYRATLSNKRALMSSILIWIISIALPFLQRKIGFLWYFFVFGNASVLVTFFVLVFAFVRVHRTLRAQIRELEEMQESNVENRGRNNALKNEEKITRAFMVMLIVFCVCYTPSLLMIYLMNFCTSCSCQAIHWFRDLSFVFVVLNSCMNPFIYALRLPNFKESLQMLCGARPQTSGMRYEATTTSRMTSSNISLSVMSSSLKPSSSSTAGASHVGDIQTANTNHGLSEDA